VKQAVILAAGSGRRVWPFGDIRQKCTIPVCNVPAVRRTALLLREIGATRIAVVVGVHAPQVRAAIGDLCEVVFVEQSHREGTAPATLLGWDALSTDEPVLVVYGDTVTMSEDLRRTAQALSDDVDVAAMVAPLGDEPPNEWLVAYRDGETLTGIVGHDRSGRERMCGIYALSPRVRNQVERNPGIFRSVPVGGMPPVESELAQSVQLMIDEGACVRAVVAEGPLVDIDKPWHVHEATCRVLHHNASAPGGSRIGEGSSVSDGAEVCGRLFLGRDCRIGNRVVIRGDVWLEDGTSVENGAIIDGPFAAGRNARIRDYCTIGAGSAIGDECIVAHGAELWGVLFDRVYLYHYCEMAGVYGSAVDIGAATVCGTLRFDDRDQMHKVLGRSEVPTFGANSSYMGDYSRTGVNAILLPGCKVGSYSCVGPGVIAYEDIPSHTVVTVKQELITKPWGPEKYGW